MRNAFNKDVYREIRNTFGRFMGIFAIVALGVSFYAGLGVTGGAMKSIMNEYFKEKNLMDVRVISNYGINENDIRAIERIPEVEVLQPSYVMDVLYAKDDWQLIFKLHSMVTGENALNQLNMPDIKYGRMPEKYNEILVEEVFLSSAGRELGDEIVFRSGKAEDIRNYLKTNVFKITGVMVSPNYISAQRGSGSIGNGRVNCFAYLPEEAFSLNYYSEVLIKVRGAENHDTFGDGYEKIIDEAVEKLENLGEIRAKERMKELTQSSYKKINDGMEDIQLTKAQLILAFDEAEREITGQSAEISAGLSALTANEAEIIEGLKTLENARASVLAGLTETEAGYRQIEERLYEINSGIIELENTKNELENYKKTLLSAQNDLNFLDKDTDYYKYALAEIENNLSEIENSLKTVEENILIIDMGKFAITSSSNDLDFLVESLKKSLADIDLQIESLTASKALIERTRKDLIEGRGNIASALTQLQAERSAALDELDKAYDELVKTKDNLNEFTEVEWFVLDRESNLGFLSYSEDSDKIASIGSVFPLVFFAVAALVSLTSMARIVEERRGEIGTLKSLGYGNFHILSKYLIYAFVPTFFGGIIGGAIGMRIYPAIIIKAYGSLYAIPPDIPPVMDNFYWLLGIVAGVFSTWATTIFSCYNELRSVPSILMRPKAPKIGKKTLIEKITFIWKRLSFLYKISIRNTFRYKKRFIMTILGISGCTALLITGYGIRDSISDIVDKQYSEVVLYHMVTGFSSSAKEQDISNIDSMLIGNPVITASTKVREKSYDIGGNVKTDESTVVVAVGNPEGFRDFVNFKNKETGEPIRMDDSGVIISNKLASILEVSKGDTIQIKEGNEIVAQAVISDIYENYFMHYIYLSQSYYEEIFEEALEYNKIFSIFSPVSEEAGQEALAERILSKKNVASVEFTKTNLSIFNDVMDSLNIVVVVLIVSAGILVFVVLLNLTNINIAERIREIATIEVLGFKDKEVAAYIYRENVILTVIGIFVGFFYGKFLHLYIILTVEPRLIVFGRDIHLPSYIYASVITLIFAMAANMVTNRQLKKINMVEALKSVE